MSTIAIDATTAQHASGGIRVVTEALLAAVADKPWKQDVLVFSGKGVRVPESLRSVTVPALSTRLSRIAYQRLVLPFHADAAVRFSRELAHLDRILLLDAYCPLWTRQRIAVSCLIHDVLPLTTPQFWTKSQVLVKRTAFASVKRARPSIFTSSNHNVELIGKELGMRATAVAFGCGQLTDAEADAALMAPTPARGDYFMYVGAIEPRKDLTTLVRGFAKALTGLPPDVRLVIVGDPRGTYGSALVGLARTLGVVDRITFAGAASSSEVSDLIRRARALVYPSHAEGFGLPVLEGLALGTPVIASSIPAIRDWTRDTVTYVAPGCSREMSDALTAVAGGDHPAIGSGKAVAENYRWSRFADATIGLC